MCNLFFKYFIKQKKNILFLIMLIILGFGISSLKKFENNKINKEKIERCSSIKVKNVRLVISL